MQLHIPLFLFLSLVPFIGFASSDPVILDDPKVISKLKIAPLFNEDRFTINYAFEGESLNAALQETLTQHLQKLGTVLSCDDSKLTEAQKQDKYRPGGMIIDISASQIVEEPSNERLPVYEITMKVISGAEVCQNGSLTTVTIWEKEKFVGMIKEKGEFIQKAVKATSSILEDFVQEYQKANSKTEKQKPQFFFYF